MGRDCASGPPAKRTRSGLSVTPAAGSGELADDPAHRVRDAQQDRSDVLIAASTMAG